MAKAKATTGANVPHRALCSRISYLYQAAAYLATQAQQPVPPSEGKAENAQATPESGEDTTEAPTISNAQLAHALPRKMISDLRDVSLKMQIRLSPAMKHTMCKRCDTLLMDGTTCTTEVENRSKGGKKPWADMLVKRCNNCGCERRYPVNVDRQPRRPHRISKASNAG